MVHVLIRTCNSVEKEDYASYIVDMREYDVIYYQRVSIDSGKLYRPLSSSCRSRTDFLFQAFAAPIGTMLKSRAVKSK